MSHVQGCPVCVAPDASLPAGTTEPRSYAAEASVAFQVFFAVTLIGCLVAGYLLAQALAQ